MSVAGLRKYTVVLADDVAALRRLVRLATEASGRFQVVAEASTGLEAIARAGECKPDLVLLDLSMPELDGLEALPRVLEAAPNSHVVVLSGFNHARMEPVAKRLGASAYLEKGVEPDQLVRALLDVLEPTVAPAATDSVGRRSFPVPPLSGPPTHAAPQRASPESLPTDDVRRTAALPAQPTRQEANPAAHSFRVLLVEANAGKAQRLVKLLSSSATSPFSCVHAGSLAAAASSLDTGEADAVILDPQGLGDGVDDAFIEVLARADAVPVVALAAPTDKELVSRALRLGIEDCLDPAVQDADLVGRSLLYAIERRRSQDARRQLRDQEGELQHLRDLQALKTQFFNAAAHELGSPLTPIRLQVARLRQIWQPGMDAAGLRSLEILERNVERMARLNQDILDVARLQAGRLSVRKRALDVKALVRDAVDTFEPVAREAGIGLTATCPEGLVIQADEQRIMQVLCNLVGNALKFTSRGGIVALDVAGTATDIQVNVRDTGPGLSAAQIGQLFQPFSQVLGPAQPPGIGAGLGLFISRGIVELHGGSVACRSEGPGRGCTFSVDLPRVSPLAAVTPNGAVAAS